MTAFPCSEDEDSDEGSEAESGAEGEEEEDGFEKIKSAKEKKKASSTPPLHLSAQLSQGTLSWLGCWKHAVSRRMCHVALHGF